MSRALSLFWVFLFATPHLAAAEWHFTPLVGLTFKGRTSGVVDWEAATAHVHKNFGGAVTAISGGTVGFEGLFTDTPGFFKHNDVGLISESGSYALMGNVVVTAPRRWTEYTLRPFVSGGLGMMHVTDVDKGGAVPVRTSIAAFNVGGGAIGFFTKRTGVRFELRYFRTLRPVVEDTPISISSVRVRYLTASVGLVIRK